MKMVAAYAHTNGIEYIFFVPLFFAEHLLELSALINHFAIYMFVPISLFRYIYIYTFPINMFFLFLSFENRQSVAGICRLDRYIHLFFVSAIFFLARTRNKYFFLLLTLPGRNVMHCNKN